MSLGEPEHFQTSYKATRRKGWRRLWGLELHPTVFFVSAGLIFLFLGVALLKHEDAEAEFGVLQAFLAHNFGWFYILSVDTLLVFVIFLLLGPFGKIRLGGADARPDYSRWSWFAMLFSAGMGIGLLFWSVAEPLSHFANPPMEDTPAGGVEAAKEAMLFSFFHWGIHAWAIYAALGLALAYFAYNKKLPLTVRSVFFPILGDRIHGWMGNVIDILAVVATLFGVATSLGFGAGQVNAGLHFLFPVVPESGLLKVIIIAAITALATLSVVLGLDKGIRRLSEINLVIGLVLLLFVLFLGPTLFLLNSLVQVVENNVALALFAMLAEFSFGAIASGVAIVVVITFFVTSSDSGSLVIDIITAGGNTNPPVIQKVFWAVLEGVVAAVLLVGGGLKALQTASITTGLPFALVLLLACFSLYRGLSGDRSLRYAVGHNLSDPSLPPEKPRLKADSS